MPLTPLNPVGCGMPSVARAVRSRSSVNVFHRSTAIKVDLFIAAGTPLDTQQMERRQRIEMVIRNPLEAPSGTLVFLARRAGSGVWFQAGGRWAHCYVIHGDNTSAADTSPWCSVR